MRRSVVPSRPPHHTDTGAFRNPWPSYKEYGPLDFFFKALPELKRLDTYALPTVRPDWATVASPREALQALWLGHATFLFQAAGFNFLTDPVFSRRASPVQFMGPARFTPPPCAITDLPPVHVVLISHNHYDHVDAGSIAALLAKEQADLLLAKGKGDAAGAGVVAPDVSGAGGAAATASAPPSLPSLSSRPYSGTLYVCPLRVAPLLVSLGVSPAQIAELDWWDAYVPGAAPGAAAAPTCSVDPLAARGTLVKGPLAHHVYDDDDDGSAAELALAAGPSSSAGSGDGSVAGPSSFSPNAAAASVGASGGESSAAAAEAADGGVGAFERALAAAGDAAAGSSGAPLAAQQQLLRQEQEQRRAAMPRIVCVPAQHQSARTLLDRNRSLWCGYVVVTPTTAPAPAAATSSSASASEQTVRVVPAGSGDVRFYFSGDTGYRSVDKGVAPLSAAEAAAPRCPAFRAIGARYGPLDLAALPIGAYSPRFFMSSFHASPEDAVAMYADVRARRSVGMHWGVFPLTDEPIDEPPRRLHAARAHAGLPLDSFVAVRAGALVGAAGGAYDAAHLVDPDAPPGPPEDGGATPCSSEIPSVW